MRPFVWEQPGRTIPGVPTDPFRLGALGSMSLSLLRPGIPVSPPRPACHGWGWMQTRHSSLPLQHGQGEQPQEPGSTCQANAVTPCPRWLSSWGRACSGGAAQRTGGDTAPSAPVCNCRGCRQQCRAAWGLHSSCQSQGHLLSPRVGSGETKGSSGWAALFPLCRELLYKGSSDIIH